MIKSITNISANANTGAWKTLTVNASGNDYLYVFGDTAFRLRRAGGGSADWIPVATAASPRPMLCGQNANGADFEVLSNGGSAAEVKMIVSSHLLM